jgi:hypothetical protein
MNYFKILIFIFLCNIYTHGFAQDFIIGVKYSYGEGSYKQMNNSEKTDFTRISDMGLTLAYSPYYSKLSLESAVLLEKTDLANYLTVPMCFRITLGKKLRPFIEGGGYYSFIQSDKSELYIMKNDLGARIGGGLVLAIGRQWRIETGIFKKFGYKGSLIEKKPDIGNTFKEVKSHISPVNIEAALKYRF